MQISPFRLGKYFILEKKTILILLFITEKKGLTLTSSLKALSVHLKLCSSSVDLFGKETEIINLDDAEINFYRNCSLMLALQIKKSNTVEALVTDTLVSKQFHLRPPLQNSVFLNSHTNSVFLHSRKWPARARFSKVPIINGPVKLLFTCKVEVSIVLHLT